ncbi:UDP-N-acetylglucosamine 2-epimerase (hydrolyzing) [Lysinibacillus sp. B2A1]|nr:UDP-N-acetylglucosamine 2-epimerase (hydrolyzing) [Lysinibacillus sp. B2A1]
MKKICVVTATRAEYGLLANLMKLIHQDNTYQLQIIVTGMHLSSEFGETYKQIEMDGFHIDEKVEMLLSSDTVVGVVKSTGLATIGFADALQRLNPDLIIILGDRYEMLAVAQTALIMQIPIAHIHGGECTFGAYDDAIRHSITKMATWHFTSTASHRNRVIQLGEHPSRVWDVGAIGIENILHVRLIEKKDLYTQLGLDFDKPMFLITHHPETNGDPQVIHEVLKALEKYLEVQLVFTKSNADNGGRYINEQIEQFIAYKSNAYLFDSLGQMRYLSAVKYAEVVIGNSSSALIEVPYLQTPSVNIGNRQAGRERPNSVFDAKANAGEIEVAINNALQYTERFEWIFGDGYTSTAILEILKSIEEFKVRKEFYDL